MFGLNPVRKQDYGDGQSLEVQDTFSTIQGEGPFAGVPALFVRLWGCNLRCHFCDTDFESARRVLSISDIVGTIGLHSRTGKIRRTALVVLTGGEPLRQNIVPLCKALTEQQGYMVQIETAGTLWVEGLENLITSGLVTLVCSPKTPKIHPLVAEFCHDWKYLIRSGGNSSLDGLPTQSTQVLGEFAELFRPPRQEDEVWLQPCEEYKGLAAVNFSAVLRGDEIRTDQEITGGLKDEERTSKNLQEAARLAMVFNYRLSIQLHKLVGLP